MAKIKSRVRADAAESLALAVEERELAEQRMAAAKTAAINDAQAVERARDDLHLRDRILVGAMFQAFQADPSIPMEFVRFLQGKTAENGGGFGLAAGAARHQD